MKVVHGTCRRSLLLAMRRGPVIERGGEKQDPRSFAMSMPGVTCG